MKKYLLSLLVVLGTLLPSFAAEIRTESFDFVNNDHGLGARNASNYPASGVTTTTDSGIKIEVGTANARLWTDGLRMYTGATIKFTVPEGCTITSAEMTATGTSFTETTSGDKTSYTIAYSATSKNQAIKTVTINYEVPVKEDVELSFDFGTWNHTGNVVELTTANAGDFEGLELIKPADIDDSEITWTSSDDDNAMVEDGLVVLTDNVEGTYTITATFAGNSKYNEASASYVITVTEVSDRIAPEPFGFANAEEEVSLFTEDYTLQTLNVPAGFDTASIVWTSSNEEVAMVEADGAEILLMTENPGTAVITATFEGDDTYKPASASYTISVVDTRVNTVFEFAEKEQTVNINTEDHPLQSLNRTSDLDASKITWSSSDDNVAMVEADGSDFLLMTENPGTVVITATFAGDNKYKPATASYTIKVVDTNAPVSETFDFVNNDYNLGARQDNSNYPAVGKSYTSESGIVLQVGTGNARLWSDGLRMYKQSNVTFTVPENATITDASFTSTGDTDFNSEISADKRSCTISYTPTSSNKALKTVTITYKVDQNAAVKVVPEFKFAEESVEVKMGEDFAGLTLTTSEGIAAEEITWSSDNTAVATVDANGAVTIVEGALGTAKITATFDGNDQYKPTAASYTIVVYDPKPKATKETVFDGFDSSWSPAIPSSSGNTSATLIDHTKGDVTISLKGSYLINSTAIFMNSGSGVLVLPQVEGVLKSISVYSRSGASALGSLDITANGVSLGNLAVSNLTDANTFVVTTRIENPVITLTNNSSKNVQVTKVVVVTEVDLRPSANVSFAISSSYPTNTEYNNVYRVVKGNESKFTAPVASWDENYDGTVTYTSSNPEVATVDAKSGEITFGDVLGRTIITAEAAETDAYADDSAFYILEYDDSTIPDYVEHIYDDFKNGWSPAIPTTAVADVSTHTKLWTDPTGNKPAHDHTIRVYNVKRDGDALRLAAGSGRVRILKEVGQLTGIAFWSNAGASTDGKVNVTVNGIDLGEVAINTGNTVTPIRLNVPEDIVNPDILISATSDAAVEISKIRIETREDKRPEAGYSFTRAEYTAFLGREFTSPKLYDAEGNLYEAPEGVELTWSSSDEAVASVDENGVITANALGTAVITVASEGTVDYAPSMAKYNLTVAEFVPLALTVKINGEDVALDGEDGVYSGDFSVEMGAVMTIDTNHGDDATFTVTDSDNEAVNVENGITFAEAGTYTYYVSAATNDNLDNLEAEITVTVVKPAEVLKHTVVFADFGLADADKLDENGPLNTYLMTMAFAKGNGTAPAYYVSDKTARVYSSNTITIALPEGCHLEMIDFKLGSKGSMEKATYSHGKFDKSGMTESWVADKNNKSNTLTITSSETTRLVSMDIYFTELPCDHAVATLDHIKLPDGVKITNNAHIASEMATMEISFKYLPGHNIHYVVREYAYGEDPNKPAEAAARVRAKANEAGVPDGFTQYEYGKTITLDNKEISEPTQATDDEGNLVWLDENGNPTAVNTGTPYMVKHYNNNLQFVTEHKESGAVSEPVSLGVYMAGVPTGISAIIDNDADAQIYTLQGIRVSEPQEGQIYIVVRGKKATKVAY